LERCRHRLAKHTVEVNMPDELVLLHIDSVLMERALGGELDERCGIPHGRELREGDDLVVRVARAGRPFVHKHFPLIVSSSRFSISLAALTMVVFQSSFGGPRAD